jgi:hypothetical protein
VPTPASARKKARPPAAFVALLDQLLEQVLRYTPPPARAAAAAGASAAGETLGARLAPSSMDVDETPTLVDAADTARRLAAAAVRFNDPVETPTEL